ncbi:MAG: hypothetical protein IJT23_10495 [Clostridia bacterium]|nr:hypothetical protein [Clostridia bacterium]
MKKILSALTAITLLAGATAINASAFTLSSYATDLKVYLNGENVYADSENQPCIMNDRTMVQIRPIFEKLGYTAEYNDATKTAVFKPQPKSGEQAPISFTDNSYSVNKLSSDDGSVAESINIDVPATIYNDTFYVPLRAFCDAVSSLSIDWDSASRSVYLTNGRETVSSTNAKVLPGNYCAYSGDTPIANLDIAANNDETIYINYVRKLDRNGYSIAITMTPQDDGTYMVQGENRRYIIKPIDENTVMLTIDDGYPETLTFTKISTDAENISLTADEAKEEIKKRLSDSGQWSDDYTLIVRSLEQYNGKEYYVIQCRQMTDTRTIGMGWYSVSKDGTDILESDINGQVLETY